MQAGVFDGTGLYSARGADAADSGGVVGGSSHDGAGGGGAGGAIRLFSSTAIECENVDVSGGDGGNNIDNRHGPGGGGSPGRYLLTGTIGSCEVTEEWGFAGRTTCSPEAETCMGATPCPQECEEFQDQPPGCDPAPACQEDNCGDGVISGTEACDDGDASSGDGCSSACVVEAGYTCTGEPSSCSNTDTDGDGVADMADLDSDNDGIPGARENVLGAAPWGDSDNDGRFNFQDKSDEGDGTTSACTDANVDDICDALSTTYDFDLDGIANHLDLDADNDGIGDAVEAAHGASHTGGIVTGAVGSNGLLNSLETSADSGTLNYAPQNTDGDTFIDALELNSDNSGGLDVAEAGLGARDGNTDGELDSTTDADSDGIMDGATGADTNNAARGGITTVPPSTDTGDTIPDAYDSATGTNGGDMDTDGYADGIECGAWPLCPDTDSDGQRNYNEGADKDSDGVTDINDADSDNDGVSNIRETTDEVSALATRSPVHDSDTDGIPNFLDSSSGCTSHSNGVCNAPAAIFDPDGDGIPSHLDLDSDNDGIGDVIEAGLSASDTNRVGASAGNVNDGGAMGTNGFLNALDVGNNVNPTDNLASFTLRNTDGDSLRDIWDLDSDGDGVFDVVEAFGVTAAHSGGRLTGIDSDADGVRNNADTAVSAYGGVNYLAITDTDGDTIPDAYDAEDAGPGARDSDGDGLSDSSECAAGWPACTDTDNDGQPDYTEFVDSDGDGTSDSFDSDADNDGIPDVNEYVTGTPDPEANADGDAYMNWRDSSDAALTGTCTDTVAPIGACDTPRAQYNTDGDAIVNHLDLDTDADGINDVIEAGHGAANSAGRVTGAVGTNGLLDSAETAADSGTLNYAIRDTDNDGTPDFRDTNSDGVGGTDAAEGLGDADTDGIPNAYDPVTGTAGVGGDSDGDGISDIVECGGWPPCDDTDKDGRPDYMESADRDGDGVGDATDVDADNDGIPNRDENPVGLATGTNLNPYADADGDGRINFLDRSNRGDGLNSGCTDANADDVCERPAGIYDYDGDGVANHLDLDSDNDGISDATEAGHGATQSAAGGVLTGAVGANGLVNTLENNDTVNAVLTRRSQDSDGDRAIDAIDLDSEDDGDFDIDEVGLTALDTDDDGDADGSADQDGDGILDAIDTADTTYAGITTNPSTYNSDTPYDNIPNVYDYADDQLGWAGNSDGDANGDDAVECPNWPSVNCPDADNDGQRNYMEGSGTSRALITSVRSSQVAGGTWLSFTTTAEDGTAGFHVWWFDGDAGHARRVSRTIIPGTQSALGGVYDVHVDAPAGGIYYIDEVEMGGRQVRYGPFVPDPAVLDLDSASRHAGLRVTPHTTPPPEAKLKRYAAAVPTVGSRVKLRVVTAGVQHVTWEAAAAALGLTSEEVQARAVAAEIAVKRHGRVLPMHVVESGLIFVAPEAARPDLAYAAYWLELEAGLLMAPSPTVAVSGAAAQVSVTVEREEDRFLATSLGNEPHADIWRWEIVAPGQTRKVTFALPGAVAGGSLRLSLHGATDQSHALRVELNGVILGVASFRGARAQMFAALEVPPSAIRDGVNELVLVHVGAPDSMVFLDSVKVTYERALATGDGPIELLASGAVAVRSPATPVVIDATDAWNPLLVQPTFSGDGWTVAVGDHRLLHVLTPGQAGAPPAAGRGLPSFNALVGADYLVVAPAQFTEPAAALVAHRAGDGLDAVLIDVEDVFDGFAGGDPDPMAIRALLRWLAAAAEAPRYLVIAGSGSVDVRNRLGHGDSIVPPALIVTPKGVFASDGPLGDLVHDDGVPEVAIGRLPVRSAAGLWAAVAKIQAHEALGGQPWMERILIVGDDPDAAGDFSTDAQSLAGSLAPAFEVTLLELGPMSTAEVRDSLTTQWNAGALAVGFLGHAGPVQLGNEGLVTQADVAALGSLGQLPLFVGITCMSARFDLPGYDTIGEALLLDGERGSVATWGPVHLSVHALANLAGSALFEQLAAGVPRLGDATLGALTAAAGSGAPSDTLQAFTLLGDPALRVAWRYTPADTGRPDVQSDPAVDTVPEANAPGGGGDGGGCAVGTHTAPAAGGGAWGWLVVLGTLLHVRRARRFRR